jgi:subtilisin family serine protease
VGKVTMKHSLMRVLTLLVTALALVVTATAVPASARTENVESYIVIFKNNAKSTQVVSAAQELGIQTKFTYRSIFQGFSAELNERQIQALSRNPQIDFIEKDGEVSASETQSSATWGIDRVDQRLLPRSGSYVYGSKGQGVRTYIVDTGVLSTHQEFAGRMLPGFTAFADGRGSSDCNGHGTHVAGTVSGTTYGVAKKSLVVPVRVLDCNGSGTWSGVIAGLDWISANHPSGTAGVANMSLGGGANSILDNAVTRLINSGVTVVVAAGNSAVDACNSSPARVPSAITVAASTSSDGLASYSNFGRCVDIIAPGSSITSAWYTGASAANTISGTSMASPHVAGAAALILESGNATPSTVNSTLIANSTVGRITLSAAAVTASTPNRLLYTAPTYSVTFLNNDETASSSSQTVTAGQPLTLSTVTRTNFTLNGWYTDALSGTKVGNAGDTYTPTSTTTLYAQWTANTAPTQTIDFNQPAAMAVGDADQPLSASSTSSLTVTFTTNNTAICTIVSGNTLRAVSQGSCTVTASQAGNTAFAPATPVDRIVLISPAPATVPAAPTVSTSIQKGSKGQLRVNIRGVNALGNPTIDSYTLTLYTSNSSTGALTFVRTLQIVTTSLNTTQNISGLTSRQFYAVTATANNSVGPSPISAMSNRSQVG